MNSTIPKDGIQDWIKKEEEGEDAAFISLWFPTVDAMWQLTHAPANMTSLPWWTEPLSFWLSERRLAKTSLIV